MSGFYVVNEDCVASKIIDREAIAINLLTGDYYSFSGSARTIWEALTTGADLARVLACVKYVYDDVPADVEQQVGGFIDRLVAEQLLVPLVQESSARVFEASPPVRRAYEPPGIEKFDDMAMMLALDPPMPDVPGKIAAQFFKRG